MPLKQVSPWSFRRCIAFKNKINPSRFLTFCFAISAFQLADPSKAFCDFRSEAVITQKLIQHSEPAHQSFGHMGTFFYDVTHYFGTRYRSGGDTPAGFDCSGFVRFMFGKAFNMHLPRSSREMSTLGNKVSKDELQPGDLVFFQTKGQHINHVGIFVGNDTFVHSSVSKGITEDRLKQGYFEKRFAGAVRLLNLSTDKLSLPSSQPETATNNSEPS